MNDAELTQRVRHFESLAGRNVAAEQSLERCPEPSMEMDGHENAIDFNRSVETNIASNYAAVLELLDRLLAPEQRGQAIDLCSGPGHFSLFLRDLLHFDQVTGVELAPQMLALARRNAEKSASSARVSFCASDVRQLLPSLRASADLVCFVNSAHHMNTLEDVGLVIETGETYLKDDGLFVLSDLGRLKSQAITEDFVSVAGSEFVDRQMAALHADFYNSMRAAWLPHELCSAIPASSRRRWFHFVTPGLGILQALVGIPWGRELFVNEGRSFESILRSPEAQCDWQFLKSLSQMEAREIVRNH